MIKQQFDSKIVEVEVVSLIVEKFWSYRKILTIYFKFLRAMISLWFSYYKRRLCSFKPPRNLDVEDVKGDVTSTILSSFDLLSAFSKTKVNYLHYQQNILVTSQFLGFYLALAIWSGNTVIRAAFHPVLVVDVKSIVFSPTALWVTGTT